MMTWKELSLHHCHLPEGLTGIKTTTRETDCVCFVWVLTAVKLFRSFSSLRGKVWTFYPTVMYSSRLNCVSSCLDWRRWHETSLVVTSFFSLPLSKDVPKDHFLTSIDDSSSLSLSHLSSGLELPFVRDVLENVLENVLQTLPDSFSFYFVSKDKGLFSPSLFYYFSTSVTLALSSTPCISQNDVGDGISDFLFYFHHCLSSLRFFPLFRTEVKELLSSHVSLRTLYFASLFHHRFFLSSLQLYSICSSISLFIR